MLYNKAITMMNLTEPKKKKRVRLQPQPSLPIATSKDADWRIYTAHLSASGTCVVDPVEMEAVYSMGFFGKGSLSRSFPSFGRRNYGVPLIARNRQWVRRQKWLEELQSLNENNDVEVPGDLERIIDDRLNENSLGVPADNKSCNNEAQASTSKEPTETRESMLNQTKNSSGKESEEKLEEPCNKKLKGDEPAILGKASEGDKETDNEAEILKRDESSKDISVIPDESRKENESQKDPSFEACEESVKVGENDKNTFSVIDDDSMKVGENDKNTFSVIGDDSVKVDEVVLDSTEDEETCEIVENDVNAEKDVYLLSEDAKSDYFKYRDTDETMMEEEANPYEVLVLPDTDSDTENYLTNVKSRIEKEGFPINETLHLTFEETFFLMYGLGCLQLIHYDGSVFSISNAWNHFQLQDKNFIQKYVVYHYFRSKGWVVKPGLKFGGDFLLYKQGPPFYHASYIVIIEVVDADTLLRDDVKSMRKVTWKNLIGMERLSETIAKEILFAQILWPSSLPRNGNQMSVDSLSDFTVRELLWRRWDPKKKQNLVYTDDENSDST